MSFNQQMKNIAKNPDEYDYVYPMEDCWTLEEYKLMFWFINKEILIQSNENCGFVFNPGHKNYEYYLEEFKK
jgi:hypothetical protein